MDSKGLINIELLFCTAIIIMILIIYLPILEHELDSANEIDENSQGRFLLNYLSSSIDQVNSNNHGFTKKIKLPQTIDGYYFTILVYENEILLEYNNKKGKTKIEKINLVDSNNETLSKVQLYNGGSYIIKKTLANNNESRIINQSSIEIKEVEG